MLGRSNCTLSTPSGNVSLVRMAKPPSLIFRIFARKDCPVYNWSSIGKSIGGRKTPVFAFHLWDSHVQNRANSAILNRLAQQEVCPHFEGLADTGSAVYDREHHGLLIRGSPVCFAEPLFPGAHHRNR